MESDKDKIIRLEEAYRKLWAEHEDLKIRIKENYAEFKVLRDQIGVEKSLTSNRHHLKEDRNLLRDRNSQSSLPKKKKLPGNSLLVSNC